MGATPEAGLALAQPSFLVPPSAACPEPRLSPPPPDEPWQALLKSEAAAAYVDRHKLRELMLQLAECVILHQPDNPERFLQEELARRAQQAESATQGQGAGVAPLTDACTLRLRVECSGPGPGTLSRSMRCTVQAGDQQMLASAEEEAAALVHCVWASQGSGAVLGNGVADSLHGAASNANTDASHGPPGAVHADSMHAQTVQDAGPQETLREAAVQETGQEVYDSEPGPCAMCGKAPKSNTSFLSPPDKFSKQIILGVFGGARKEKQFRRCAGCRQRDYCSEACQRKDWPLHRQQCLQSKAGSRAPSSSASTPRTMSIDHAPTVVSHHDVTHEPGPLVCLLDSSDKIANTSLAVADDFSDLRSQLRLRPPRSLYAVGAELETIDPRI